MKGLRINWPNVGFLMEAAIITRALTAFTRMWQNMPSKFQDQSLTPNQKRQALMERVFVEGIGTLSFVTMLQFGQDLAAKLVERTANMPVVPKNAAGISAQGIRTANETLREVFGQDVRGVIARILYGNHMSLAGKPAVRRANLTTIREALHGKLGEQAGDALFSGMKEHILPAVQKLNRGASWTMLAGITLSVLVSGPLIQKLNDRWFSPLVAKKLAKRYGEDKKPQAASPESAPEAPAFFPSPEPTRAPAQRLDINTFGELSPLRPSQPPFQSTSPVVYPPSTLNVVSPAPAMAVPASVLPNPATHSVMPGMGSTTPTFSTLNKSPIAPLPPGAIPL
ncbi:MAG TPA: hypothetical protein V6C52_11835 [Coleofasciculaceae cyanobacterium]|jgi:hypothetical protein